MASGATDAGPLPARQLELNVSVFFPLVLGIARPPPLPEGIAGPAEPDRIVLLNPLTQGMLVLRAEGDADEVFSNLVRDLAVTASMGDDGVRGPTPASKAAIEAIVEVAEVGEEEECPVCLEELRRREQELEEEEGDKLPRREREREKAAVEVVKEMPCGHRFHGGCIEKWLGMHGSCPVCRYLMPEEQESGKKGGGEERRRAGDIWVSFGFDRSRRDAEGGDSNSTAVEEPEPATEQRRGQD